MATLYVDSLAGTISAIAPADLAERPNLTVGGTAVQSIDLLLSQLTTLAQARSAGLISNAIVVLNFPTE